MQQDTFNIDLKLPNKWEDLTEKQLRYFFGLLAQDFPATQITTYCLFRWSGMKVCHRYGTGYVCRLGKHEILLQPQQVAEAIVTLDWLDTVPSFPIRISRLRRHKALPADFEGVPFETFIVCDNLYQGYLHTKNGELLDDMAVRLYSLNKKIKFSEASRISIFYWFASLKGFLARVFKHFFQPVSNASDDDGNMFEQEQSQYEILQNAVNAQIRALTKGDITRTKVRQRRKWFSRKYYASVMNIKEFYEDNIGRSFTGIIADFARRCNCHK